MLVKSLRVSRGGSTAPVQARPPMAMLTIWAITTLAEFLASDKTSFIVKRNEIFERGTHKSFHALFLKLFITPVVPRQNRQQQGDLRP